MQNLIQQIDRGQTWRFPGGIHPPECKTLSSLSPIGLLPVPPVLRLPLRQHIGNAGELLVNVGDKVLKGQPLTRANGPMALPIHAPSSGTISAIKPMVIAHPSGLEEMGIEIITDGEDQWRPRNPINDPSSLTPQQLQRIVDEAGIAGLGGATFPSAVKLSTKDNIELLLINGAECEPYISADDRLMQERADEIVQGIALLDQILSPSRVLIAVEDNKPDAIKALQTSIDRSALQHIILRVIPTKYPSGSEKQLIQILTGWQVPKGKLPADLGVLMVNVGTTYAIKRAVIDDEPLIERVVTVTGEQAGKPGNYWTKLGTPVNWLMEQTHTLALAEQPLIHGGPMMGFALTQADIGLTKGSNCIIAPSLKELPPQPAPRNCIRCGECAQVCPQQLLPQQLFWHSQAGEYDKAEQQHLFDCIECGACAFVCSSDIPLVQHYRVAKAAIREERAAKAKSDAAKIRFEARQARLEKEKQERESRHKKAASSNVSKAAPSAGVAAAIAKLKAQKESPQPAADVDMAELRRQRKEQARAAKAAQLTDSSSAPESSDKPAAVAAAIAKAKAKQQGDKPAAVAAAIAKAKAKQAASTVESAKSETPPQADRKAAVAAAIAKAKAKQAASTVESAQSETPPQADRKAAVAAAIAKAKAKQAAEQAAPEQPAEAPSADDRRKAAVAAAIAKAKAKKMAEQTAEQSAPEQPAEAPSANDKRTAAVAAAIAKAKAKKAAEQTASEQPAEAPSADDKRKAAVAAAIAKAKAKKASEQAVEQTAPEQPAETPSADDKRKAAVAAAIAKAKAKKASEQAAEQAAPEQPAEAPSADDKRKAAVAAAIAKAKAKKAADQATEQDTPEQPAEAPSADDKRKAAVAAAIAKAKAKKAAEQAAKDIDKENN